MIKHLQSDVEIKPKTDSGSPSVLIVDDQEEIRHLIRITLPRHCRVIEAKNAAEAMDTIWLEHPNVIILDITLPGGPDGLSLLEMIRRDPELSETPVVIVSARTSVDYRRRAEALRVDAFVEKPFSPVSLGELIREFSLPSDTRFVEN